MTDDLPPHHAPDGSRLPADLTEAFGRIVPGPRVTGARPLTGGVSSEIWLVDTDAGPFVVKRALAVLRTDDRWEAPVERSGSEAAWLRLAHTVEPDAVPRLHGVDEPSGALVLEYLDHDRFTVWKQLLLTGHVDPATAASMGGLLRGLHDATADHGVRPSFDRPALIHALRLEPYLLRTADRHPEVARPLRRLVTDFHDAASTVVHGDVSPKNVLVSNDRVVLIDAECATWGDRTFDLSFCLTHLCAKAAHLPHVRSQLRESVDALCAAYGAIDDASSERAGRWLAALLLARVDGASPLEYLDAPTRTQVRSNACRLLTAPAPTLERSVERWFAMLDDDGTSETTLPPDPSCR